MQVKHYEDGLPCEAIKIIEAVVKNAKCLDIRATTIQDRQSGKRYASYRRVKEGA